MTVQGEPLPPLAVLSDPERIRIGQEFAATMRKRRTVRDFKTDPIPMEAVNAAIAAALTAPNGANRQPWHFVIVTDREIRRAIRLAAEEEERAFYNGRAPKEWLEALAPLGTNWEKPFLEDAPVLIVIFQEQWGLSANGARMKNYYAMESVGIATGFLIASLHQMGLATLTHTPSPMGFLREILKRPANEKAAMILVVGHPKDDARVPVLTKKQWDAVVSRI